MPRPRLTLLHALLAVAGAAVAGLAGVHAASVLDGGMPGVRHAVAAVAAVAGLGALLAAAALLRRHFRQIERLRGGIVTLAGDENAVLPLRRADEAGPELARVWQALGDLSARYTEMRTLPDERLQAVLATIAEAIVVITDSGQVSLVNASAKRLLGEERVRIGTSVFAALHRHPVLDAVRRAERAGRPIDTELPSVDDVRLSGRVAPLGAHGGAVLSFAAHEIEAYDEAVEHALDLHDRPPAPGECGDATPLDDLAMLVVDTETTGLAVEQARVLAIGAVRLHGARVYRGVTLDRLVRPDAPIPPGSTAVHGITSDMVADAPAFPAVFDELRAMMAGTVMVGHNIGFDIAVLAQECRRFGLEWRAPASLDTLLLAGALLPEQSDLRLEALAAVFDVDVHGRHTALGDCLVTAQVLQRMLPLLHDRGAGTLGAARAFAETRRDLVRLQHASGW